MVDSTWRCIFYWSWLVTLKLFVNCHTNYIILITLFFCFYRIWSSHFCSLFGSTHCFVHSKSNAMWPCWSEICTIRYNTVETCSLVARQILFRVRSSFDDISCWISCSSYQHIATSPIGSDLMGYWDSSWRASSIFHLKGRFAYCFSLSLSPMCVRRFGCLLCVWLCNIFPASISGSTVDEIEELDGSSSEDSGFMATYLNWIKRWLLTHSQHLNFFTVLVLASVSITSSNLSFHLLH